LSSGLDAPDGRMADQPVVTRRKLPNMNEFSPGQLGTNNIRQVLKTLAPAAGHKTAMIGLAVSSFPRLAATGSAIQREKRARNVLIGMSQCGLLERTSSRVLPEFTEFAKRLIEASSDSEAQELFAKHLLQKCEGLELLDVVAMIQRRAEDLTLDSIRSELRARGFAVTENEGNASKIRMWLEPSGVIDSNWAIDEGRLQKLVGATTSALGAWQGLPRAQRAFLEQVRALDPSQSGCWLSVRQIKKLVEASHGRSIFPEGALRASVIRPLVAFGWIESRGERSAEGARGGDSGDVRALPLLLDLQIELLSDWAASIPPELRSKLSTPMKEIFRDLISSDAFLKGLALEVLSLRFARDVGLNPVGFRVRGIRTQGAEVDLVAESLGFHYSRWLIQCKNTAAVHVKDVAKEAGMATVLKAQVICMVTTGRFGGAASGFADGLSKTTALQVLLIDSPLLERYRDEGPQAIIEALHKQAQKIRRLKQDQVIEVEED
jgi:hypothetical protein